MPFHLSNQYIYNIFMNTQTHSQKLGKHKTQRTPEWLLTSLGGHSDPWSVCPVSSIIPNSIRQPIVDGFNKHAHTNHAREPLREIQSLHNKKNQNSISVPSSFNKRSLSSGFAHISCTSGSSPQQGEFFFISKKYFQRLKTMDSILWVSLGHIKPFLGIFCKFFHI